MIKLYAYDFTNDNIGYRVIGPNEDVSGEYVLLAEYQALKAQYLELGDSSNDAIQLLVKQRSMLQALIQRVVDMKPNLGGNYAWQNEELTKLLKDCQEAVA